VKEVYLMTTNIRGNPLWKMDGSRRYKCGCIAIRDKAVCPIHMEPLREQMIYGNDTVGALNEKDRYKEQNLNEGK